MENFFQLIKNKTTVRTEVIGGLTTFVTMAYILIVNPATISQGNPAIFNGVFFATCIASFIGTLMMALYANAPLAQAPGMGLNASFAFAIMPAMAVIIGDPNLDIVSQYQMALSVVLLSGIVFLAITFLGLREMVVSAIPGSLKAAIGAGIGLMLAIIGLKGAGIVIADPAIIINMASLNTLDNPATQSALLALLGLVIITALYHLRFKAAILIGIAITTILGYMIGVSTIPETFSFDISAQAADFFAVSFLKIDFSVFTAGSLLTSITTMIVLIISFSLSDMFDTIGTVLAVAKEGGLQDENGNIPFMKKAFFSDAIATMVGALTGTSTVTTYVESAAGIGAGAKTGLSSLVVSLLFLASLILAPIMLLIPGYATAPALIFVGALMLKNFKDINYNDMTLTVPALLTAFLMPLTSSIATGISIGILSYVVLKLVTGGYREVKPLTYILAVLFILKFSIGA